MTITRAGQIGLLAIFVAIILAVPVWLVVMARELPSGMQFRHSIVDHESAKPGGVIIYSTILLPHEWCHVTITRRIHDASSVVISSSTDIIRPREKPESIKVDSNIAIPESAVPGAAVIRNLAVWRCNWLQTLFPQELEMSPLRFTIRDGSGAEGDDDD